MNYRALILNLVLVALLASGTWLPASAAGVARAASYDPPAAPAGDADQPAQDPLPQDPDALRHYNSAVDAMHAGRYAEAKSEFEAVLKTEPTNARAVRLLGFVNDKLGVEAQQKADAEHAAMLERAKHLKLVFRAGTAPTIPGARLDPPLLHGASRVTALASQLHPGLAVVISVEGKPVKFLPASTGPYSDPEFQLGYDWEWQTGVWRDGLVQVTATAYDAENKPFDQVRRTVVVANTLSREAALLEQTLAVNPPAIALQKARDFQASHIHGTPDEVWSGELVLEEAAFRAGDARLARDMQDSALRLFPRRMDPVMIAGDARYRLRDYASAAVDYNHAMAVRLHDLGPALSLEFTVAHSSDLKAMTIAAQNILLSNPDYSPLAFTVLGYAHDAQPIIDSGEEQKAWSMALVRDPGVYSPSQVKRIASFLAAVGGLPHP